MSKYPFIRLRDVPPAPAYLVFHDAYDRGAMHVIPCDSLETATRAAKAYEEKFEREGYGDDSIVKAYAKLPRVRIWKLDSKIFTKDHAARV